MKYSLLLLKITSIRFHLSIATTCDFEIEQLDVKIAFLHGDLEAEIYMRQSGSFHVKEKEKLGF